jgi:hypothetical protein
MIWKWGKKRRDSGMDDHIWKVIGILSAAVAGLYGLLVKIVFMIRASNKGCSDADSTDHDYNPGIDVNDLVTKDVCLQTQRTINAEVRSVTAEINHVREILVRVEKNQDDKHRAVKVHIDSKFGELKALITKGNQR